MEGPRLIGSNNESLEEPLVVITLVSIQESRDSVNSFGTQPEGVFPMSP